MAGLITVAVTTESMAATTIRSRAGAGQTLQEILAERFARGEISQDEFEEQASARAPTLVARAVKRRLPEPERGGAVAEASFLGSKAEGELETLLRRTRLRFPPETERAFRADYAERWRSTNRVAFAIGLGTFAAFGFVDLLAYPFARRGVVPAFRAGCSTRRRGPRDLVYVRVPAPDAAGDGGGRVRLRGVDHRYGDRDRPDEIGYHLYFFGLAPVTAFGYAAPRMRFWYATATEVGDPPGESRGRHRP